MQVTAQGLRRVVAMIVVVVCATRSSAREATESRYTFYRRMGGGEEGVGRRSGSGTGRRMFGGKVASLNAWPPASTLLDRYWVPHCSASVVRARWALTAAHCVTSNVAYVKYNTRHPSSTDGEVASVLFLYRHPRFKVVEEDEGRGIDVTQLHHDVGLVRTSDDMRLAAEPPVPPIDGMILYDPQYLKDEEVDVLGFGRTEDGALGEQLYATQLRVAACARSTWQYCVCGIVRHGQPYSGVCSGDSGGPVLFRGVQVGVTSMGPVECGGDKVTAGAGSTSVLTALKPYVPLLNATILDLEASLKMERMSRAPLSPRALARLLLPALLVRALAA